MNIVLDTNVVINGFRENELACLALMLEFYGNQNLSIVMDFPDSGTRGIVMDEYFRNLKDNEGFQKWYTALSCGQIDFYSGKLDERIKEALLKKGFHEPSDHTFVALSLNSDKNLVTEESDYGMGNNPRSLDPKKQDVLRYLTGLGLNIMDSQNALLTLRQPRSA